MKIIVAARFSALLFLSSLACTLLYARTGLRIVGVLLPRQVWLTEHALIWSLNWWLWLAALVSWMMLLIALMWGYLPGHRFASMMQAGMITLAATLAVAGVVTWMVVLPVAVIASQAGELTPLVDALAVALVGAGFLMMGVATVWITVDLLRLGLFSHLLLLPGVVAGLSFVLTPFLLPRFASIVVGSIAWIGWCMLWGLRRTLPSAHPEWS